MSVGIWQIVLIILVVVLLFGGRKIPKLMGDFAEGIKAFKKGIADDEPSHPAQKTSKNHKKKTTTKK